MHKGYKLYDHTIITVYYRVHIIEGQELGLRPKTLHKCKSMFTDDKFIFQIFG